MARLLPFRSPERATRPRQPRLIELDDETADEVFAALASETARAVLVRLYQEPAPASEVAEAVGTSLQNARYHLENLLEAGLIEEVDTWYSSRGTEMTVYAPTNEPLVVAAGPEESTTVLQDAVKRLLGAIGLLGIASVGVDVATRRFGSRLVGDTPSSYDRADPDGLTGTPAGDGGAEGDVGIASTPTSTPISSPETTDLSPSPTPSPTEAPTPLQPTQTPVSAFDGGPGELFTALPPGLLFFVGGLSVVLLIALWWYWRRYRPLYGNANP